MPSRPLWAPLSIDQLNKKKWKKKAEFIEGAKKKKDGVGVEPLPLLIMSCLISSPKNFISFQGQHNTEVSIKEINTSWKYPEVLKHEHQVEQMQMSHTRHVKLEHSIPRLNCSCITCLFSCSVCTGNIVLNIMSCKVSQVLKG